MLYHLTATYRGDAHLWGVSHFSSCFQFKIQPSKINVMGEYSDKLEVKKGVINYGEYHFRDWRRLGGRGLPGGYLAYEHTGMCRWKTYKLPCPGVKFPKMIPCPGVRWSLTIPCPLVSLDNYVLCKEICTKSIEKCGNIAIQAI